MSDDNVVLFKKDLFSYTILYDDDLDELLAQIDDRIYEGWRPHGQPFIGSMGEGYCQAMNWKGKK